MISIKDEIELDAYIRSVAGGIEEIKAVLYVDVDDDLDEITENYFKNHFKGTVLFFGIFEEKLSANSGLTWSTPQLQATILAKYNKQKPGELIAVRDAVKKLMVKFIHKIKADQEENYEQSAGRGDSGYHWTFKLHNDLIMPIAMDKSNSRGWSCDFEIGFPVTEFN